MKANIFSLVRLPECPKFSFPLLKFVGLLIILYIVSKIPMNDGIDFCVLRSELPPEERNRIPHFVFDKELNRYVLTGGIGCLEDVVNAARAERVGPDGLVGTDDDPMTTQEHFDLVFGLLQALSPHCFFADSEWHFNHSSAVTGMVKLLYADSNEYVLLFGAEFHHGGYAGSYDFDVFDFVLEGLHETHYLGQIQKQVFTANPQIPEMRKRGASQLAVYKSGQQKLYNSAYPNGAFLLEYGRGTLQSCLFPNVIVPTFTLTLDFQSAYISIKTYFTSTIKNWYRKLVGWNNSHPPPVRLIENKTVRHEKLSHDIPLAGTVATVIRSHLSPKHADEL